MTTLRHNDIWRRDFDISTSLYNDISTRKWRPANIAVAFLLAAAMLTACGGSDSFEDEPQNVAESATPKEITIKTDITSMQTRATTIDDDADLQDYDLKIDAYFHDRETKYLDGTKLHYDSSWKFWDGAAQLHYYWPIEGSVYNPASDNITVSSLDFVGYCPYTTPAYITTGPTYSVPSSDPQASFTCTLPMTYNATTPATGQGSDMKEFIWGITIGQNKTNQGASGVTMKFRRPFARLRFQLAASHPNVQINNITFKALKTGGTCTLNNTDIADDYYYTNSAWSSLTGNSNLVMTLASKDGSGNWIAADVNTFNSNPSSVVPIGGWGGEPATRQYVDLLVIPQTFGGVIEVDATWTDKAGLNQILTTTISSVTWQSGYSYTYTFTISPNDLVVNTDKFTEQW